MKNKFFLDCDMFIGIYQDIATKMSTRVEVSDVRQLKEAVKKLRSDAGDHARTAWLIVSHVDNDPNFIALHSEGEILTDCVANLLDDQVMYILFRVSNTYDMSTTVKFVYVHWLVYFIIPCLL